MSSIKIRGIVLKENIYKESDKIISVLAKDHGKIVINARGARKANSKFLSASEVFSYSDFVLNRSKNYYYLSQANLIDNFYKIREDLDKIVLASYFSDMVYKILSDEQEENKILHLLITTLNYINKNNDSSLKIKAIFELKILHYLGYQPELYSCLICSSTYSENFAFSPEFGGVICKNHSKPNLKLESDSLLAMKYIEKSNHKNLFNFYISDKIIENLNILSENFLLRQLGGNIKAFDKFKIF